MNENNKLNHLRENKDDTDYVKVYDRTLKKEKYLKLEDIKYQNLPLKEIIGNHSIYITNLEEEIKSLKETNIELKDLLEKIWGGLNSR